jgi:predicted nucleic acid-binding protein
MDVVIDTSAIMAVIVNEPERDALIELTKGADLIAPFSVHWEIGNAFSALLRRKRATLFAALQAIEAYGQIPIRFVDVELHESIPIAHAQGIYAYDAYLIRCAQKYRSPLLSLDRYLVQCALRTGVQVLEVHQ